jgi:membrane protease subunit HflC
MSESTEPDSAASARPRAALPLIAAAVMVVLVLAAFFTYQLRVTEVAVVTTLGKPSVQTRPGLHMRLFWPIQKVQRFDARGQLLATPLRQTITRDNVTILVRWFVTWHIDDPLRFYASAGSISQARSLLAGLVASAQEGVVRQHTLGELLAPPAEGAAGSPVETKLLAAVAERARSEHGIAVDLVAAAEFSLNAQNTASVLERMVEEQKRAAAEIRSEGEKAAAIIRADATSRKAQRIAAAEAEAKRIRGRALVAAAEQYETLKEDVEFALFLRKLDALEKTMQTGTTVILDSTTPPIDLLRGSPSARPQSP